MLIKPIAILSVIGLSFVGCETAELKKSGVETDFEGYTEIYEMPDLMVTCVNFGFEEPGYTGPPHKFIISQFPLKDYNDIRYITTADYYAIPNSGSKLLVGDRDENGNLGIDILAYNDGLWKKNHTGLVITDNDIVLGMAESPESRWALVTYFKEAEARYIEELSRLKPFYEDPKTNFYYIDLMEGDFEGLEKLGHGRSLIVRRITDDNILFSETEDVIIQNFVRDWTLELQLTDTSMSDVNPTFFLYALPFYDSKYLATYTDNGEYRAFFRENGDLVFRSFAGEYEPSTVVFSTKDDLIQVCTDRNGEDIVCIKKSKSPETYIMYYISTDDKTYAKYEFKSDSETVYNNILITVTPM
jgi:hypothetical protein